MRPTPIEIITPMQQLPMVFEPMYDPNITVSAPASVPIASADQEVVTASKGRKCRDILCLLVFIAALGLGVFAIIHFKLFANVAAANILLEPADNLRRICGRETQPDVLSVDYSRVLDSSQFETFCEAWKKVYEENNIDCPAYFHSNPRGFFALARAFGTDMENRSVVLQGKKSAICLNDGEDVCNFRQGVKHVCSDELEMYADALGITGFPADLQFTETEFSALNGELKTKQKFLLNFCVEIMEIKDASLNHYTKNEILTKFGITECNVNLSTYPQMKNVNALVQQATTVFSSFIGNLVLELKISWRYIIYGTLIGIAVMALYLLLLEFIMKFVVYLIVGLVLGVSTAGGIYFIYLALQAKTQMETVINEFGIEDSQLGKYYTLYMVAGCILVAVALIVLLFVLLCCKRIRLGVAVLETAIRCSRKTWKNFLLPLPFAVIFAVHIAWSGFAAFEFYLEGTYDARNRFFSFKDYHLTDDGVMTLVTNEGRTWEFFAFVFLVVWGTFAIFDMLQYMICYAVANWYFSDKTQRLRYFGDSISCALRSMGTCCVTSFITSLVWMVRFIINYILRRMEESSAIANNKVIKGAIAVGKCCLKCLEKIVKWINRNVIVYAAITGEGYCKSMHGAMSLLTGSFLTSGSIKVLSIIFLEASKLIIAIGTGLLTMLLIERFGDNGHQLIPSLCVGILVYVLSFYIIGIMNIMTDTVLLCFLYEDDMLRDKRLETGISYAPSELTDFLNFK